jgi:hypothetical protein
MLCRREKYYAGREQPVAILTIAVRAIRMKLRTLAFWVVVALFAKWLQCFGGTLCLCLRIK